LDYQQNKYILNEQDVPEYINGLIIEASILLAGYWVYFTIVTTGLVSFVKIRRLLKISMYVTFWLVTAAFIISSFTISTFSVFKTK